MLGALDEMGWKTVMEVEKDDLARDEKEEKKTDVSRKRSRKELVRSSRCQRQRSIKVECFSV